MRRASGLLLAVFLMAPVPVWAQTPAPGLAITLHQDGPALVRERRVMNLERGGNSLTFDAIPSSLRPDSAMVEGAGFSVTALWTTPALTGMEQLLAALVGKPVEVVWEGGGNPQPVRVLAAGPLPLFEAEGKVVVGQPARLMVPNLPMGLSPRPALHVSGEAEQAGPRGLDLSYAADGLGWSAHANAELDGERLRLVVWADMANGTDATFTQASLRLVAGATRAGGGPPRPMLAAPRAMAAEAASLPQREAAGPFHVYTLAQPVTLPAGSSRQVPLLPAASLAVSRSLELDAQGFSFHRARQAGSQLLHPVLRLGLANTAKAGLGVPLPAMPIRVTMKGPGGEAMLLGQDHLPALPEGASATMSLGEAFDLTAAKRQTDFQRVSAEVSESAWELRLANAGGQAEKVVVREAVQGEWLILEESHPHLQEGPSALRWEIPVPAKGEVVLRYRIRVK